MGFSRIMAAMTVAVGCAVSCTIRTPGTSDLFMKRTDPESGAVSYLMKPGIIADNQQSLYFVNKAMTEDGRFLIMYICDDEFENEEIQRSYACIDFRKDKVFPLLLEDCGDPNLDTENAVMYYYKQGDRAIFYRELRKNPMKEHKLCDLPEELQNKAEKIFAYDGHLSFNNDYSKVFMSMRVDDRFVQGLVNVKDCTWEQWCETDFIINHDNLNPVREDIALCANEVSWTDTKGVEHNIEYVDGVYPRLQLFEPGKRTMVPPMTNYATHEHWTEQGDAFYWCTDFGVCYCDLESGEQYRVSPIGVHAMMSADKRYVVSDERVGYFYRGTPWKLFFWDRELEKGLYVNSIMPGVASAERQSRLHPDPHPQFVCTDKYIIYTQMCEDHRMTLAITPTDQLKDLLAETWIGELPAECSPRNVAYEIIGSLLPGEVSGEDLGNGPAAGLWAGALDIVHRLGDYNLEDSLTLKLLPFLDGTGEAAASGAVNLAVYSARARMIQPMLRANDDSILQSGMLRADCARDSFEKSLLATQMYRCTGDVGYIEGAAKEVVGNIDGWMPAGIPLVLKYLPEDNENHEALLYGYRKLMASALASQGEDGLWENAAESAVYIYCFIEGIKHGWLDPSDYIPAAHNAWMALCCNRDDGLDSRAAMLLCCNALL